MTARRPTRLLTPAQVRVFFDRLAAVIDPKSELNWSTPLDLLVAVVLSAQCTDKAVNRVTAELWRHCRTPDDYLRLGEAGLREQLRTIGLFRNKTRSVIGLCRMLRDEFGGAVPPTREELERLPGVGRKTANVVLNVVFGQPTLAVDTHVFRVANRVGLAKAKTPEKTELALLARVPAEHLRHAHHYLILHGRYTCTARQPRCPACPVRDVCNFPDQTPG